ncbi:GNAT family N-acetyltransferase [Pareuzebyella sediminis]|uniref:GNAT family N-acetyltransferase n=1 Tax=Pareuzebyella sediminis TaxID=2607998 RepID=UPI001E42257D|nr:GNAT family N-acetyltransferase [Pareuzebyella sediminis]
MAKKYLDRLQFDIVSVPKNRFELNVDGQVAFIDFIRAKENKIFLTHTEVPKSLEGKGVGSTIVSKVLGYIRENNLKLVPLCPFVAAYIKRHPEKVDGLLAKGYSVS